MYIYIYIYHKTSRYHFNQQTNTFNTVLLCLLICKCVDICTKLLTFYAIVPVNRLQGEAVLIGVRGTDC